MKIRRHSSVSLNSAPNATRARRLAPGGVRALAQHHGRLRVTAQVRPLIPHPTTRPLGRRREPVPFRCHDDDAASGKAPRGRLTPRPPPHRTPEHALARDQARALANALKPALGGPSPDAVRALSNVFGGPKGHVTLDAVLATTRCERGILTERLHALLPRHTLEEFLGALANVHSRVRVRTPLHQVSTARTLTEKEARLEFAFALYDLDGDGVVGEDEIVEVVEQSMRGNAKKIATTLRVALEEASGRARGDGAANGAGGRFIGFVEFKRAAEKLPGFLYPAFALYEILREHSAHAAKTLSMLRSSSDAREGGDRGAADAGTRSPSAAATTPASASSAFGRQPRAFPGAAPPRLDEGEVRRRCADMTDAQLRAFLEALGNDLGLELLDRSELVDLAAASALSTGRTPDPSATRRSPASSPRRPRGAGDTPRRRAAQTSLRASLADSLADRAAEIVGEAFRAARMGRGEALEGMIRRGEVGPNARDGNSECDFALLHVAAVNGSRGVCRRLLALGADKSAVDARGRTALDLALRYNHSALADYLRQKGLPYGGDADDPVVLGSNPAGGGVEGTDVASDEELARRIAAEEYLAARREARSETNSGRGEREGSGAEVRPSTETASRRGEERRRGETDVDDAASFGSDPPRSDEGPLLSPE